MDNQIEKIDANKIESTTSQKTTGIANRIADALEQLKTVQISAWDLTAEIVEEGKVCGIEYRNIAVTAKMYDGSKELLVSNNYLPGDFLYWWLGDRYVRQLDDDRYVIAHEDNYTEQW